MHQLPDDGSWDDAITLLGPSSTRSRCARRLTDGGGGRGGRRDPSAEEVLTLDMLAVACRLDPPWSSRVDAGSGFARHFGAGAGALGIDLGTTNSVAAIATSDGVEFILGSAASACIPRSSPSVGRRTVVGSDAKRYKLTEPQHVIHSAKRFIGQNIRAAQVQLR